MFIKNRLIPLKIRLLEALLRRLPLTHPKRPQIAQELNRRKAGLWGEREVDKKLEKLDPNKFMIFSDLRIPHRNGFSQIDTLVLSTNFALIIEAKNIAGTLEFDLNNHQLIRTNNEGVKEGFPDSVSQARLQQQQIKEWLNDHKLPNLPIDFLVISANPHSIFYISPHNHPFANKIQSLAGLTWEIDKLCEIYNREIINDKDLKKISKALLKAHTPPKPSEVLRQYDISISELLTGVHCPQCEYISLTYKTGKWYCPRCQQFYKDAHHFAINDYFYLFDSTITNSQFRKFLHISKTDTATNMLRAMDLISSGTKKGRFYRQR